jgi:hypothetical protein
LKGKRRTGRFSGNLPLGEFYEKFRGVKKKKRREKGVRKLGLMK